MSMSILLGGYFFPKILTLSSTGFCVFSFGPPSGLPKTICAMSLQSVGMPHSLATGASIRGL